MMKKINVFVILLIAGIALNTSGILAQETKQASKEEIIFNDAELSQLIEDIKYVINADVFDIRYSEPVPPNGGSLVITTTTLSNMFDLINELQRSFLIKDAKIIYSKRIESGIRFEFEFYFTKQARDNDVKNKELARLKEKLSKIF